MPKWDERSGVTCPNCGLMATGVIDSRPTVYRGLNTIRRRRECQYCGHRFTTHELPTDTIEAMDGDAIQERIDKAIELLKGTSK